MRTDDPVNGDIVTLFAIHKEMAVDNTNTCQEYCPQDGSLTQFSLGDNSTDMGKVVVEGKVLERYFWQDTSIFGVMDTTYLYVDQSGSFSVPVQQYEHLTPFGQDIGQSNSTWSNFQEGTPAASLFDIKGIDSCPMSQNCGDNAGRFRNSRRARRLAAKLARIAAKPTA